MELSKQQIDTLAMAGVIPAGTPPAIIETFAVACRSHGLDPFRKEIHLVKYNTKRGPQYHTIVGIDGLQQKAARTGRFAGCSVEMYNLKSNGAYRTASELIESGEHPKTCTIVVSAIVGGIKCDFTGTAVFEEYYPGGGGEYSKAKSMPFNMIAKCARAKALKIAFSDELSGLHIEEERAAFEDVTISSVGEFDLDNLKQRIAAVTSLQDLKALYEESPEHTRYAELFTAKKDEL